MFLFNQEPDTVWPEKVQFLIYICFRVAGVVSSREYFDRIKGFIKLLGKANEEI